MKYLYVFKIGKQTRYESQVACRRNILSLLNVCFVEFELLEHESKNMFRLMGQEYTFDSQEEARKFAISILETEVVFFSELKKVKVK